MTLREFFQFHSSFKNLISGVTIENIVELIGLGSLLSKNKFVLLLGMNVTKGKASAMYFFGHTGSITRRTLHNPDAPGIALYHQLIERYCLSRLVIVSSNDEVEYDFCKEEVDMSDYKK